MLDTAFTLSTGFAQHLGLVAIVIVAYTQLPLSDAAGTALGRKALLGVVFGATTALSMSAAIEVAPGLILDARSMLLALASAFGGPVAAMVAAVIAGSVRLGLGGAGALPGLVGIALTTAVTLIYVQHLRRRGLDFSMARLFWLGLLAAGASLAPLALIADHPALGTLLLGGLVSRPFTILGTIVFGLLLLREGRRRRLERDLAEAVGRYRLLADNARDAITLITRSGERRYASPALSKMLGYAPAELVGKPFLDIVHPDDAARVRAFVHAPDFGVAPTDIQYRMVRKDGTLLWVEASPSLSSRPGADGPEFVCVVRDISKRKAVEAELTRAHAELEELSRRDPLTGLANRRHMDAALTKEWRRSARNKARLSILMIDIDYFKAFNDRYGHQVGDNCLQRVARAISDQVRRPADIAARYGGEEFVVVLPETEADGARRTAEQIADAIRAVELASAAGIGGRVTVSIGVATVVATPQNGYHTLLAAADGALYAAKSQGRDRVVCASELRRTRDAPAAADPVRLSG